LLKSSLLPLKIHMFDWSFSIFEVWYLQTPVVAYPLACWTILHLWIIYFQKGDKIVCQILRLWDWPCSSKGCPHFVSCSKQMENWDCFFPAKLWGPREISKEKQHKSRVWESRCKMIESRWQRAPAKRIEIETNQVLRIARANLYVSWGWSHALPGFPDDFPMSRHPKTRDCPTSQHKPFRRCGAGFVAAVHLGRGLHAQSGKCQERLASVEIGFSDFSIPMYSIYQ
jgi:hypothetical protein